METKDNKLNRENIKSIYYSVKAEKINKKLTRYVTNFYIIQIKE